MSMSVWLGHVPPLLRHLLLCLGAGVVVGHFHADFTRVLALAVEAEPLIALSSAGRDDGLEVRIGLANQLRLLVVVEDGHLEAVVVGRVVDSEAQLLVPACVSSRTFGS